MYQVQTFRNKTKRHSTYRRNNHKIHPNHLHIHINIYNSSNRSLVIFSSDVFEGIKFLNRHVLALFIPTCTGTYANCSIGFSKRAQAIYSGDVSYDAFEKFTMCLCTVHLRVNFDTRAQDFN